MLDDMARTGATIELSPGERRLLQCLANGETVTGVARRRRVSPETTRDQAKKIRRKLGVPTLTRAVALAVDEGLIEVKR
jgi:DNA-binding NarL/FixJ family response regulator